jgi:hypothetical protein
VVNRAGKAEVAIAGKERLSNEAEPLQWLYMFYKTVLLVQPEVFHLIP